jgi:hypothetical protein
VIVFQVVFCVLGMVGLVTAFNWADHRINAAVMGRRIRERAELESAVREAIREEIIRLEVTDLDDDELAAFIAQGESDD